MKKKLIILLHLLLPLFGFSQINGVHVSNFKLDNNTDKWCWAFEQDNQGLMFIGVSKGVVLFDGGNQNLVNVPFTPSVMKYDKKKEVLWLAGLGRMGYMQVNSWGEYEFKELKALQNQEFYTIQLFNDSIIFVSDKAIVIANENKMQVIDSIQLEDEIIDLSFVHNNHLYFVIDYFIYEIENGELVEKTDIDFPVDDLSYSISIKGKTLIGNMEDTYYMLSNKQYVAHDYKSKSFFKNNLILSGSAFNDEIIVLGSLARGIAFVDVNTNKIINKIDYFTGLPDDEIRALFVDRDFGVWVSHGFGISRIDISLGTENYSYYPGLKGNPIAAQYFNNELYVATSDGLYSLQQIKDYDIVKYQVRESVSQKPQNKQSKLAPKVDEKTDGSSKKERRKNRRKSNTSDEGTVATKSANTKNSSRIVRQTRTKTLTKRNLRSISHAYKLIDKVTDKCKQLVVSNNYLFAAGNNGLYAIKNNKAETIINNVYVNSIYANSNSDELFCCTNNGLYKLIYDNKKWRYDHFYQTTNENIYSIAKESGGKWVMAVENKVIRASISDDEMTIIHGLPLDEESGEVFFVKHANNITKVFTKDIIYIVSEDGKLNIDKHLSESAYAIENESAYAFVYNEGSWSIESDKDNLPESIAVEAMNLGARVRYVSVINNNEMIVIDESNSITKYNHIENARDRQIELFVSGLQVGTEKLEYLQEISLPAKMRNFSIEVSAPFYLSQNGVEYTYWLKGFNNEWSKWSETSQIAFQHLPAGSYVLRIKAKDKLGNVSPEIELSINVAKPFTQTILFYALLVIAFIFIAFVYSKFRLKKLEIAKQVLEQKVKERTQTIEHQKDKIEKQHSEIKGSIRYAERIQKAMLPLDEIMEAMLPKHFVLFLPRDVVSGDFYFFKPIGKHIAFVAADCTGHGVPGGFMSMLGISYLSEITSHLSPSATAAEVINHLRDKIKLTLGQTDLNSTQKDGMDLSICLIDTESKTLQFSGAFNPLLIIRNNEIVTIKADRQPVSVYYNEKDFTNHIIDVQQGDKFYMFSDGYPDQIGGPKGRKFMSKNFKSLLLEIHTKPMEEQESILHEKIIQWRGKTMQVDDILVIGFEL